jgi:hypothetical protein
VSTRSGYARFAAAGKSPFGFATSAFNYGHMNEAGHALVSEVVGEEMRRVSALF